MPELSTSTTPPRLCDISNTTALSNSKRSSRIGAVIHNYTLIAVRLTNIASATHRSRLRHVQKQLRQRLDHLLAAGSHIPGRVRIRGSQAGFSRRRSGQQNTCSPRSHQGKSVMVSVTQSILTRHSETQKSSRRTRRRSSQSTRTSASRSPVSPPMPASSPTS